MTRCTICNSPNLAAISDLADANVSLKEIAAQFHCSYPALVRHCARHRNPAPAPATENGETLEVQAARWLSRADDVYASSTANQDTRGQVQALTAAFRGLELQHKSEKAAEAAPVPGAGHPATIEMMDEIIQRAIGDRRSTLIDKIFAAPDATLDAVETLLSTGQVN
jgi:hypothetical protein